MEFLNNQLSARQISKIFANVAQTITIRTVRKARQGHADALARVREAINNTDRKSLQEAFEKELENVG